MAVYCVTNRFRFGAAIQFGSSSESRAYEHFVSRRISVNEMDDSIEIPQGLQDGLMGLLERLEIILHGRLRVGVHNYYIPRIPIK